MASWNLSGNYAESCNCGVPCPCNFTQTPTQGECHAWAAWHIDEGDFDGTPLSGLNVAFALHAPGHMLDTKWKVALYVDEAADNDQREALQAIFSGEAGGLFGELKQFIGEVAGVRPAAIGFEMDGNNRSFSIAGAGEVTIEALPGEDGKDVLIQNAPLSLVPGTPLQVARGKSGSLNEYGISLDATGHNGYFAPFSYRVE